MPRSEILFDKQRINEVHLTALKTADNIEKMSPRTSCMLKLASLNSFFISRVDSEPGNTFQSQVLRQFSCDLAGAVRGGFLMQHQQYQNN